MGYPTISIIIPTLNSAATLDECLESVYMQEYPRDRLEVLVVDGGSTDATLEIARKYGDAGTIGLRVVPNPLKTGEAAKAAGVAGMRNSIAAFIDSDNVLTGKDWLQRLSAPFADEEIIASEPIRYSHRRTDHYLTRYFAMLGMNDPLCLFLGNYDRECLLTGAWTGIPLASEDKEGFRKVTLSRGRIPTIGANGFLIRHALLRQAGVKEYLFDIDVLQQLIEKDGMVRVAKVDIGIIHVFTRSVRGFARKQGRRVADYLHFRKRGMRGYSWNVAISPWRLAWFVADCLVVLPLLVQSLRGWWRSKDPAWLFHPVACWITLYQYSAGVLTGFSGSREYSREAWKQA